jgi:hypothetical protein
LKERLSSLVRPPSLFRGEVSGPLLEDRLSSLVLPKFFFNSGSGSTSTSSSGTTSWGSSLQERLSSLVPAKSSYRTSLGDSLNQSSGIGSSSSNPPKRGRPIIVTGTQLDVRNAIRCEKRRMLQKQPLLEKRPRGRPPLLNSSRDSERTRERRHEGLYTARTQALLSSQHPRAWDATLITSKHRVGRKAFPDVAEWLADHEKLVKSHENSKKLLKDRKLLPARFRKKVLATLVCGMSASEAAWATGFQTRYISAILDKQLKPYVDVTEDSATVPHSHCAEGEIEMYRLFFESHTIVRSGSKTLTRVLREPHRTLFCDLYAEYPRMLRELAARDPSIPQYARLNPSHHLSKHLTRATAASRELGFDQKFEYDSRMKFICARYKQKLSENRNRNADTSKIMAARRTMVESPLQNGLLPEVVPVSDKTFWRLMSDLKTKGLRWTTNYKPYPCEIHDSGEYHELELERISGELKKEGLTTVEEEKLLRDKRFEEKAVNHYHLHRKQFEACRPKVDAIMNQLARNECLLYRDFVNQHNVRGKKVNNLVFVLIQRNENGVLIRSKISNFCSDSESNMCDADFVADVFEFHLQAKGDHGSGLFEEFTKIYVSGDHGPHFSSIQTLYNESRMKKRWGKQFHIISLCSYHCYNSCDAAGAESKTLSRVLAKAGTELLEGHDFTMAVRESNYENSWAFTFKNINRDKTFWGDQVLCAPPGSDLRSQCEILYQSPKSPAQVHELHCPCCSPGVVYVRPIPGVGDFKVMNLLKGSQMCQSSEHPSCSDIKLWPVFHLAPEICPLLSDVSGVFQTMNLDASPNEARITSSLQETRSAKTARTKPAGAYPCKLEGCPYRSYAQPGHANLHMRTKHKDFLAASTIELYPLIRNKSKRKLNPNKGNPTFESQQEVDETESGVEEKKNVDETESGVEEKSNVDETESGVEEEKNKVDETASGVEKNPVEKKVETSEPWIVEQYRKNLANYEALEHNDPDLFSSLTIQQQMKQLKKLIADEINARSNIRAESMQVAESIQVGQKKSLRKNTNWSDEDDDEEDVDDDDDDEIGALENKKEEVVTTTTFGRKCLPAMRYRPVDFRRKIKVDEDEQGEDEVDEGDEQGEDKEDETVHEGDQEEDDVTAAPICKKGIILVDLPTTTPKLFPECDDRDNEEGPNKQKTGSTRTASAISPSTTRARTAPKQYVAPDFRVRKRQASQIRKV